MDKALIKTLDKLTASQIAAGEVVERPVSVVKELVENAIDAGSDQIVVKIKNGGLEKIQVIDNGCGMSKIDMRAAFGRHATSKINKSIDLANLSTLGFRGEALPSIAAISEVLMISKTANSDLAWQVKVKEGKPQEPTPAGSPIGTNITINNLFKNVPARKKFIDKPTLEGGKISDLMQRLILSQPQIGFKLYIDERQVLHSQGTGSLEQAVLAVYGNKILKDMIDIKRNKNNIGIDGLISLPKLTRASRNYYNFIVNGRWIKSKDLISIVEEAYDTLIPEGRYPIVIINLQIPAETIDVNVHPAKMVIKFSDKDWLKENLLKALKEALYKKDYLVPDLAPDLSNDSTKFHLPGIDKGRRMEEQRVITTEKLGVKPTPKEQQAAKLWSGINEKEEPDLANYSNQKNVLNMQPKKQQTKLTDKEIEHLSKQKKVYQDSNLWQEKQMSKENKIDTEIFDFNHSLKENKEFIFSELTVLGQWMSTYIIASKGEELFLIDQHAAHERLQYEGYFQNYAEKSNHTNLLAIPARLDLSHQESVWLLENIINLADLGFVIEHFGEQTFLIRGIPVWYGENDGTSLLLNLLAKIEDNKNISLASINKEILFQAACKSAIKANDTLTSADITWLLQSLDKAQQPMTCPHGRPVIIKIKKSEVEKRFLRT